MTCPFTQHSVPQFASVVPCFNSRFKGCLSLYCTHHILFIHSSIDGHLDYFHFRAILINAAMNLGLQMSLQGFAFNFLGYISRGGTVRLYHNSTVYKESTSSLTSCISACVHVSVCAGTHVCGEYTRNVLWPA